MAQRALQVPTPTATRRLCARRRVNQWRRLLCIPLAIGAVLGAGAVQSAGLVFSDNFESGKVTKWAQDDTRDLCQPVQRGVDGSAPHGGQYMLQCNWNGTVGWNAPNAFSTVKLPQEQWIYTSEFLLRLWIKYDQDVSHTFGGKVLRFFSSDNLDGYYLIAQMQSPSGPAMSVWQAFNGVAGPTFWGAGAPLGNHGWHKLEIYMKASTSANGIARVWFDGVLVQQVTNTVTVAPGQSWGPLHLMSNWSNNPGWEHGANNHIYWDDVEMYTDTGVGGTGQLSDASIQGGTLGVAPNAPSAVQVF